MNRCGQLAERVLAIGQRRPSRVDPLGAVALRHVILLFRVAVRAETTVDLMSTPLVDWLRAQDDATLAALVRLRPDLTVPPPADLTVLATRAGVRASVHRACDDLDTPTLAVLEALVVADADQTPVPRAEMARLLGPDVPGDALDTALATLRAAFQSTVADEADPVAGCHSRYETSPHGNVSVRLHSKGLQGAKP